MSLKSKNRLSLKEISLFALFGALMYVSKLVMEFLPNIHLIAMFVVTFTVVYRAKALYPIYIFVLLTGLMGGFGTWWIPYLYIWAVLWAITMLLPKRMPKHIAVVVYALLCTLHGLLYGVLYAPVQAFVFGLSFEGTIAWIAAGFPFDLIHGIGNFFSSLLILPLVALLKKISKGVNGI